MTARKTSGYFQELRDALLLRNITHKQLAYELELSERTIILRFNNIEGSCWMINEQYQILDLIGETPDTIPYYFPRYPVEPRIKRGRKQG